MRAVLFASLVALSLGLPRVSGAQEVGSDAILDSLAKYLSRQWGFPYTGFVGNDYVKIGNIYGYDEPEDYCDLLRFQKKGRKIKVSLFDSSLRIDSSNPVQTQRYLVQDRLATFIAASLAAELRAANISADGFRDALKSVQLRFVVSRVAFPEADLIGQLRGVKREEEIKLSSMHGFISPHELLVISEFDYDEQAAKMLRGGLALNWLPALQSTLSGARQRQGQTRIGVPEFSVAAFKVVPYPPQAFRCR